MPDEEFFHEEQRFRQPELWTFLIVIFLVTCLPIGFGMYQQLVLGRAWGNRPMSNGGLILLGMATALFWAGIMGLFAGGRLITEVRTDGVYARFIPFHFSFVRIPWDELRSWEAATYNPIRDYGGWGIRYGFSGKAYNVSGNRGVRLVKRDGGVLMIGSQRAEELERALNAGGRRTRD